jgi:hypothetical protein
MTLHHKVSDLMGNAETHASFAVRAVDENPTLAPDYVRQQDAFQSVEALTPYFGDIESMGDIVNRHCAVHAPDLMMYQTGKALRDVDVGKIAARDIQRSSFLYQSIFASNGSSAR